MEVPLEHWAASKARPTFAGLSLASGDRGYGIDKERGYSCFLGASLGCCALCPNEAKSSTAILGGAPVQWTGPGWSRWNKTGTITALRFHSPWPCPFLLEELC